MIRNKYCSLGKLLSGLGCFSIVNGCSDEQKPDDSSGNGLYNNPPSVTADEATENFVQLLLVPEEQKSAIVDDLKAQGVFRDAEEMSRVLSKGKIVGVMKDMSETFPEIGRADFDLDTFVKQFKVLGECAAAIGLYSIGKSIYAQAADRDRLFSDVIVPFVEYFQENEGVFEKKDAIEQILHRREIASGDAMTKSLADLQTGVMKANKGISDAVAKIEEEIQDAASKLEKKMGDAAADSKARFRKLKADLERVRSNLTTKVNEIPPLIASTGMKSENSMREIRSILEFVQKKTEEIETGIEAKGEEITRTIEDQKKVLVQTIKTQSKKMTRAIEDQKKVLVQTIELQIKKVENEITEVNKRIKETDEKTEKVITSLENMKEALEKQKEDLGQELSGLMEKFNVIEENLTDTLTNSLENNMLETKSAMKEVANKLKANERELANIQNNIKRIQNQQTT
ncbi:MAG: hypothetical protein LBD32_02080 [Cytophagales bacterium]|jgi:predicted  nucleic acid-binding Zn-ribbon protein|nr:hypothetical protein [Cytophagales bacterium]